MEEAIVNAIKALLNDDEGVCEAGYDALHDLIEASDLSGWRKTNLHAMLREADAINGRFFFKESLESDRE